MFRYRPDLCVLLCLTNFIFHIATSVRTLEEECPGMNRECVQNYYGDLELARRYPVKVFKPTTVLNICRSLKDDE